MIRFLSANLIKNHRKDDTSSDSSQKNALCLESRIEFRNSIYHIEFKESESVRTYAEIRMITRIGSFAMVVRNIDSTGPNAIIVQPMNSRNVMLRTSIWRRSLDLILINDGS